MKLIKATIVLFTMTAINPISAERFSYLCESTKVVEIEILNCKAEPAGLVISGKEHVTPHDLIIKGRIVASVPIAFDYSLKIDLYQSGLNIERDYVYEKRSGKTCADFNTGENYLMEYEKFGCELINDKNHDNDNVCKYGGHRVTELPQWALNAIKEFKNKSVE